MEIVDQIRPHPRTSDDGAVMISAGKRRAAATEIEALRRIVERFANSSNPQGKAMLIALGSEEDASRAVRAVDGENPK